LYVAALKLWLAIISVHVRGEKIACSSATIAQAA
jgi:hypothetical protein